MGSGFTLSMYFKGVGFTQSIYFKSVFQAPVKIGQPNFTKYKTVELTCDHQ